MSTKVRAKRKQRQTKPSTSVRVKKLEEEVAELKRRLDRNGATPIQVVTISTLDADDYTLRRPIPVVIQDNEGDYLASYCDANIHASGDTVAEAIGNVKDQLVGVFSAFDEMPEDRLGPPLKRDIAALRKVIRKLT